MKPMLKEILHKRFNYTKEVEMKPFLDFCNTYFTADKSTIIEKYFDGVPVQVISGTHKLAVSRIQNLAHLAAERYYVLKLEGTTDAT